MASSLDTHKSGSDLILEICQKMNATEYLSGRDGRNYLVEEDFIESDIDVFYQDFKHPVYRQIHGQFISAMSVADMFFNCGEDSVTIIKQQKKLKTDF